MDKMTLASKTLVQDTRGANLVEYMMLVGLIAIIAIAGFSKFGTSVKDKIEKQSAKVDGIPS
jgi:pilus assembly protein Flp/PilA